MQRLLILLMVSCLPLFGAQAQHKFTPPPDAKVVKLNGKEYLTGDVYLPSHADTVSLTALGFRDLEFEGRSVGTVKYRALWPVELALAEMPKAVSGLDYDYVRGYYPFEDYESPVVGENPVRTRTPVTVRSFDPDFFEAPLTRAGPGWQCVKRSCDVGMNPEDLRKFTAGESPYSSRWDGGAAPTAYKNPSLTGTFRVLPEECGPFHKKENVGTRDPHTTGNFMLTPIETTERSSLQVRDWSNGNPYTGTMNWGTSGYYPPGGVGYHQFPVGYSSQYRPGIRVRRTRP